MARRTLDGSLLCETWCVGPWNCEHASCRGCGHARGCFRPPAAPTAPQMPPAPPLVYVRGIEGSSHRTVALPSTAGMLVDGWWSHGSLAQLRRRFVPGDGRRCRIAVVGSSGNLLFRSHGRAIDAHDVVIRTNAPTLAGYEADVGRRTDLRVAWVSGVNDAHNKHLLEPRETLVFTTAGRHIDDGVPDYRFYRSLPEVLALSNAWATALADSPLAAGSAFPSTGFQALSLALAMAQLVGGRPPTVFGYGACPPCYKYYDCDGSNASRRSDLAAFGIEGQGRNGFHPFAQEHLVRSSWHRAGVIELHEPSCDGFKQRYAFPPPPRPPPERPPPPGPSPPPSRPVATSAPVRPAVASPPPSSLGDSTSREPPSPPPPPTPAHVQANPTAQRPGLAPGVGRSPALTEAVPSSTAASTTVVVPRGEGLGAEGALVPFALAALGLAVGLAAIGATWRSGSWALAAAHEVPVPSGPHVEQLHEI